MSNPFTFYFLKSRFCISFINRESNCQVFFFIVNLRNCFPLPLLFYVYLFLLCCRICSWSLRFFCFVSCLLILEQGENYSCMVVTLKSVARPPQVLSCPLGCN